LTRRVGTREEGRERPIKTEVISNLKITSS